MKKMQNKIMILVCMIILCANVTISTAAYAQDPLLKLGRGISNAVLGFMELPINIENEGKESGITKGATYGVLKGFGRSVLRTLVGVYETATFWIPIPGHFQPILTNPEFIFEKKKE